MTASKSSRARNARARAARSGNVAAARANMGGTATRPGGTAVKQPAPVKGGTVTKTAAPVRTGANSVSPATRANGQAKAAAVATPAAPGGLLAKVRAQVASMWSP